MGSKILELGYQSSSNNAENRLHSFNFLIKEGDLVSIYGRNGSGKSAILNNLMGIDRIKDFFCTFNGKNLSSSSTEDMVKHGFAYIPQRDFVNPILTVSEFLELPYFFGKNKHNNYALKDAISIWGEDSFLNREEQLCGNLSGGEKKILALLRAFINKPEVIVIDDFAANLSVESMLRLEKLFEYYLNSGGIILLASEMGSYNSALGRKYIIEEFEVKVF